MLPEPHRLLSPDYSQRCRPRTSGSELVEMALHRSAPSVVAHPSLSSLGLSFSDIGKCSGSELDGEIPVSKDCRDLGRRLRSEQGCQSGQSLNELATLTSALRKKEKNLDAK